jgi:phosphate transport system protein
VTHYEARLEEDLEEIRREVEKVGGWVDENVRDAVISLTRFDRVRANETILRDRAVNKRIDDIDHLAHLFVIKHLPSAGHLRFVSAVMRVTVALERVGDYAVTICRETLQLTGPPPTRVIQDVEVLGQQVQNALKSAIAAFITGDLELAASGIGMAKQVESTYRKTVHDLQGAAAKDKADAPDLFSLLIAIRVLKRASDQAVNICEQTSFAVTGEAREEKRYRILFMDEDNKLLSAMAESFAKEAFPDVGRYLSAGANPAPEFDADFLQFLKGRGVKVEGTPQDLQEVLDQVDRHFHIIVGVGVNPSKYIDDIPFRTVVLEWDAAELHEEVAGLQGKERLQGLYRALSGRVDGLMRTLGLETDR